VIAEGTTTHEFASAGRLKPLRGCFAGLELGHVSGGAWHKQQQYALTFPQANEAEPKRLALEASGSFVVAVFRYHRGLPGPRD
jgi:hypothetical protein